MLLALAAALTVLGVTLGGPTAAAQPLSPDISQVCTPEASVCYGIRGDATQGYRFWFTIQPPPVDRRFTFTVNGVRTDGSLRLISQPTRLGGEFTPAVALIVGDRVCMYIGTAQEGYCGTVI
ncbi:hypothetical protein [Nonomuraea antimicrobica]|uniref:hypothetical protein n=1 Tax=Nonomuraea antimicrobica TaxID=561173 RepID=UPI0031EEE273